jgi:hypothetical protein
MCVGSMVKPSYFFIPIHCPFLSPLVWYLLFGFHNLQIYQLFIGFQQRKKLTMMEIPSIFIPEDWSFTFYEGLNRHPDSIFRDKTVAELGCGNGWISIALAEKWSPSKVGISFLCTFLIHCYCTEVGATALRHLLSHKI